MGIATDGTNLFRLRNDGAIMEIKIVYTDKLNYDDVRGYAALLPTERREKIDRLRFDKDKLLSLTAGLLIRAEVGDTPLATNAHGKPYAVGSDRFFSVSHSGDCVAVAADDSEIGVDVEQLTAKDDLKLAERFYHPNELAFVQNAEDHRRAFTRIWTRKESYLKQTGVGIATDLRAFDTTSKELSEHIQSVDLDGYVLSVCTEQPLTDEVYISALELNELLDKG